jgi:hypothetical protein
MFEASLFNADCHCQFNLFRCSGRLVLRRSYRSIPVVNLSESFSERLQSLASVIRKAQFIEAKQFNITWLCLKSLTQDPLRLCRLI